MSVEISQSLYDDVRVAIHKSADLIRQRNVCRFKVVFIAGVVGDRLSIIKPMNNDYAVVKSRCFRVRN